MWFSAYHDTLKDGQIVVNPSKWDSSFDNFNDASTLAPYQGVAPATYKLRWRHSSEHSTMGDGEGNFYDYFSVTLTYECNTDALTLATDIGLQTYTLGAASL